MTYDEICAHWGDYRAVAAALDVVPTTVHSWRERGIPHARQYELQVMSRGKLRADPPEKRSRV
jgi:hypothetical protein